MIAKNTELQRFDDEIEAIEDEVKERNAQKSAAYEAEELRREGAEARRRYPPPAPARRRRRKAGGA
jgi:hypothetical protein